MPSKVGAEAYRFHSLSGHNELFEFVELKICEAYANGFSVIEITRIIGSRKADYVHSVLVKHGVIQRGKPGRSRKGLVPTVLASYLRKRSLSYAKWCAGWSFDLEEAACTINMCIDGPVMDAIRRDFPGCYSRMKELSNPPEYMHPPEFEIDKLEANISWDFCEHCYRAEKMCDATVRGYGPTMEFALKNLKISNHFLFMWNRLVVGCGVNAESKSSS